MEDQEKQKLGLIHIITGEGKGKTTSAMGMVVRAHGRGLKVKIIQLFKRDTGEFEPLKKLGIDYAQFKPFHPFFKKYSNEHLEDMQKELLQFWKEQTADLDKFDLLVVDEMGPGINWKVFEEQEVINFLKNKPKHLEVILTGRDFPESVKKVADYVSSVNMEKHPFEKGIQARKGIEF